MTSSTPHQVDRLVIGDVAGMTASFIDKREGLSVLLCEKAPYVGSMTATSGGTAWVPGTHLSRKAGVPDRLGLACNSYGQVLDTAWQPIASLYACGNDLASIFQGSYPAPAPPSVRYGVRLVDC